MMIENFSLREAKTEDVSAMANLLADLPEWFSADEVETMREVTADSVQGIVAVNQDNEVIGFNVWEQRRDEWEICWIGVLKRLHRQGIGKKLLARMLEHACEARIGRVRVKTVASTTDYEPYARTRAFYEACGFRLESIEPHWWPDGCDKAEYVLDLNSVVEEEEF